MSSSEIVMKVVKFLAVKHPAVLAELIAVVGVEILQNNASDVVDMIKNKVSKDKTVDPPKKVD